jgi:helix-turn-helix protein
VCRVLNLCPGTYYGRRRRPPSVRAQRDAVLIEQIKDVRQAGYGTYGAYRVHKHLRRQGVRVARCTVASRRAARGQVGDRRAWGPHAARGAELGARSCALRLLGCTNIAEGNRWARDDFQLPMMALGLTI